MPAFFCRQEKLKLKRGTTQYVNMVFLPLVLEQHRCTIIFADNQVGEFQHEIIGNVELPEVSQVELKPTQQIYIDQTLIYEPHISFKNTLILDARRKIEQLIQEKQMKSQG